MRMETLIVWLLGKVYKGFLENLEYFLRWMWVRYTDTWHVCLFYTRNIAKLIGKIDGHSNKQLTWHCYET